MDVSAIDNTRGEIRQDVPEVQASDAPSRARKVVRPGTVIYSTVRPYLRNVALVTKDYIPEPIASTAFAVLLPFQGVDAEYLFLCLRSPFFNAFVEKHQKGVAYPAINDGDLQQAPIPLPHLTEQRLIVARVDELMALCDDLEARQDARSQVTTRFRASALDALTTADTNEELATSWQRVHDNWETLTSERIGVDELRQAIVDLAIAGRFEGQGWGRDAEVVSLGDVVALQNGYAFKSSWYTDSGVGLVRGKNISHGAIDWSDRRCVTEERAREFDRFHLQEGDIVLALDRPIISTGLKVARVRSSDLPALLLQRVTRLTVRDKRLETEFLWYWLNASGFVNVLDPGRSKGVPHISTKQIAAIPIELLDHDAQLRAIEVLRTLLPLCERLEAAKYERSETQQSFSNAAVHAFGN